MSDGYKVYASQEYVDDRAIIPITESCHIADLDVGTYVIKSNWLEGPAEGDLIKVTICNTDEDGNIDEDFWEMYDGTLTISARYEEETDGSVSVITSFVANGNMNTPSWYSLSEMQDDDGNIYMQNDICCIKNASNVEESMLNSVKFKIEQEGIEVGKWYSGLDHYWGVPTSDIPASAITETIDKNSGRFKVPSALAVKNYVSEVAVGAIIGVAEGKDICLTDISPNSHRVVIRPQGKNLLFWPYEEDYHSFNEGIMFSTYEDGVIWVSGTATNKSSFNMVSDRGFAAGIYTVSAKDAPDDYEYADSNVFLIVEDAISEQRYAQIKAGEEQTFTLSQDTLVNVYIEVTEVNIEINGYIRPQIEKGSVSTEYVSPISYEGVNITINGRDDGFGKTGFREAMSSPNMRITGNVDLCITYHKDINKIFEEIRVKTQNNLDELKAEIRGSLDEIGDLVGGETGGDE